MLISVSDRQHINYGPLNYLHGKINMNAEKRQKKNMHIDIANDIKNSLSKTTLPTFWLRDFVSFFFTQSELTSYL